MFDRVAPEKNAAFCLWIMGILGVEDFEARLSGKVGFVPALSGDE